ncbi:MAG: hypothetical protein WC836_14640 [Desulfobacula sp.]|jgi:hypothetical protein
MKFEQNYKNTLIAVFGIYFIFSITGCSPEVEEEKKTKSTMIEQSKFNNETIRKGTSGNLSPADIAWHAQNTYGWDCPGIVEKYEEASPGNYFKVQCTNGKILRVYYRDGQHPKITNEQGTYN